MNNVVYFRWTKMFLVIRIEQDNLYNCQWLQTWTSILSPEHHLLGDVLTPGLPLASYTIFETLRIIYRLGAILGCEGVGTIVRSSVSIFEQTSWLLLHVAKSDTSASNLQKSNSFFGLLKIFWDHLRSFVAYGHTWFVLEIGRTICWGFYFKQSFLTKAASFWKVLATFPAH